MSFFQSSTLSSPQNPKSLTYVIFTRYRVIIYIFIIILIQYNFTHLSPHFSGEQFNQQQKMTKSFVINSRQSEMNKKKLMMKISTLMTDDEDELDPPEQENMNAEKKLFHFHFHSKFERM